MALYLIGIGLWDKKDISVKGLEVIRNSSEIYLESYTSKLNTSISELERFYGKKINIASREFIENRFSEIIDEAQKSDIAVLIIGDVFSATTHISLFIQAKKAGVKVSVIHNASIVSAIGIVGLEIYKFGRTTSIPFENQKVYSPIDVMNSNKEHGLHTLFLFDLDPKSDRYMSLNEAVQFLIDKGINPDEKAVGIAGVGSEDPNIFYGKLSQLQDIEAEKYPQCLIIPGNLHFMEEEALNVWDIEKEDNADKLPEAPGPEENPKPIGETGQASEQPKQEAPSEDKPEEDKSWKDYLKENDLA
jgi:diphthine synthase